MPQFRGSVPGVAVCLWPTIARNGSLYFGAYTPGPLNDYGIYRAELVNGEYAKPELLPRSINLPPFLNWTPFLAPDESYLLFSSNRRDPEHDGGDLYVSRRLADGSWTDPVSLGEPVNTDRQERLPVLSNDGKYLFFTRPTPGSRRGRLLGRRGDHPGAERHGRFCAAECEVEVACDSTCSGATMETPMKQMMRLTNLFTALPIMAACVFVTAAAPCFGQVARETWQPAGEDPGCDRGQAGDEGWRSRCGSRLLHVSPRPTSRSRGSRLRQRHLDLEPRRDPGARRQGRAAEHQDRRGRGRGSALPREEPRHGRHGVRAARARTADTVSEESSLVPETGRFARHHRGEAHDRYGALSLVQNGSARSSKR